ncbi:MAG TPA: hypothetical protein VI758_04420 [Bacteroidota bacterium]
MNRLPKLYLLITALLTFLPSLAAAQSVEQQSLVETLSRRISVEGTAGMFLNDNDYGSFESFGLLVPLHTPLSSLFVNRFDSDLSIEMRFGAGSWYQNGNLQAPLSFELVEAGLRIPFAPISENLALTVTPSIGFPSVRNYHTGRQDGVFTYGVDAGVDMKLTDFLGASVVYSTRQLHSEPFLWSNSYQTLSFGISFAIGDAISRVDVSRSAFLSAQRELSDARDSLKIGEEEARIAAGTNTLLRHYADIGIQVERLTKEVRNLNSGLAEVKQKPGVETAEGERERENETFNVVKYDKNRLARVRVIRINKRVFDRGDLVEEDYLKSILATINNYDNYVWAVAYRDSLTTDAVEGRILAEKIQDFFTIYNSNFERRICPIHDANLASEFEIRCLGLAAN